MRFAFIHAEKANHSIARLCRVLEVTRGGYYAWRNRPPSRTAARRQHIETLVEQVFDDSYQTYGSPRVLRELRETHRMRVGKRTVENAMKALGIQGRKPKGFRPCTTERDDSRPTVPNALDRDSQRQHRMKSGSATSHTSGRRKAGRTSLSFSTCSHGKSLDGRCGVTCRPIWCWMHWRRQR